MKREESLNKENEYINSDDTMGYGYRTYGEAAANRRSDETTIYDWQTGLYYNVKSPFSKKENKFLGSKW